MARIVDLSQVGYSNEESYTEDEAVTIRHLIAESQSLLDALDAEVDDSLPARNKHFDYVQRGKAALAPLKKLPQEVIGEVFLYASWSTIEIPFPFGLEVYDDDDPNNETLCRLLPTQVVMAQVCSAWRKIAFSIPWLWNTVSIERMDDHTLAIASELLSRARGSVITLYSPYSRFSSKAFDALIMPNQFKYLWIRLSYKQLLQFYQLPLEACVNLDSLLLFINCHSTQHELSVTLNPDKYPRLRHLSVHLLGPGALDGFINLQSSIIPWHQLTTLSLYIVHSSQLNVLRHCMSLTSCDIAVEWVGINDVREICLHRLLNFTLTTPFEDVPSLLRIFNFPNLEAFETTKLTSPFSEDIQELMLQRFNFRRIRFLTISRSAHNIDIGAILSCASSLESLRLHKPITMDQNTMSQVARGSLGPFLRRIDLIGYQCTWDQVLKFAETRWESAIASQESGSSLKITLFEDVRFDILDSPTPDHLRRREALITHGTRIQ